ncbi:MAG: hypothetical protein ACRDOO_17060 [Actinomadura sp.]
MTKLLTFTELEDLVRTDPDLDADEALEYGRWRTEPPRERRRVPGWLSVWRDRRRPRAGKG